MLFVSVGSIFPYSLYVHLILPFTFAILSFALQTDSLMMMRAAQFVAGGPENITVGEVPVPNLRDREVLIKVYASAINRADTLQRKGLYPPPAGESSILGLEAAGTIDKLGPGATKWKVGDRVMALVAGGGNAEFVAAHEDHVMSVPQETSFTDAAAIPETWLTAYQLLHFLAEVKAGDSVLIHAGGSGVGIAAVQLTRLAGATPIVTAGSQHKIDTAKKFGASEGFNYKDEEGFADKVMQATGGKGVDVILDCVGASFWEQNIAAAAQEARWIVYGLMGGGSINGDILAKVLRKWITIKGTTIRTRSKEYKASVVRSFSDNVVPHFTSGKMRILVDSVYSLEQLGEAHAAMESNKNTGKIIIRVRPDETQQDKSEL